jgi:hypothetical protein
MRGGRALQIAIPHGTASLATGEQGYRLKRIHQVSNGKTLYRLLIGQDGRVVFDNLEDGIFCNSSNSTQRGLVKERIFIDGKILQVGCTARVVGVVFETTNVVERSCASKACERGLQSKGFNH